MRSSACATLNRESLHVFRASLCCVLSTHISPPIEKSFAFLRLSLLEREGGATKKPGGGMSLRFLKKCALTGLTALLPAGVSFGQSGYVDQTISANDLVRRVVANEPTRQNSDSIKPTVKVILALIRKRRSGISLYRGSAPSTAISAFSGSVG